MFRGAKLHLLSIYCLIHIYGKSNCIYCIFVEKLFSRCNAKFIFHDISKDINERRKAGFLLDEIGIPLQKVPQIFFCKEYIGGYSDVVKLIKSKELNNLLSANKIKHENCES